MTKKDYELIASVFDWFMTIQIEQDSVDFTDEEVQAEIIAAKDIALTLADRLYEQNPRFDSKKFLTACGIQD